MTGACKAASDDVAALPAPELPDGYADQADAFYPVVKAGAERCGVTRLANITGLDRIGLPVWQAVRPLGRALSVHQGKGSTPRFAQIGALCEAIESHCAEQAPADGPLARFSEVPSPLRATSIADYCGNRSSLPHEEPIRWCEATDLLSGGRRLLPHPCISLDYTSGLPSALDRTSSGLGAGADEASAIRTALLEAIERDAVGEWRRAGLFVRLASEINAATLPFVWFQTWLERLRSMEISIRLFHVRSVTKTPVLACEIASDGAFGPGRRGFSGSAAAPDAERALFKALAEAVQSRLTWIAGVRDDILPRDYWPDRAEQSGRPRFFGKTWQPIEPGPATLASLAERLAGAGFADIHWKRLDAGLAGVAVAKVFVPGLGSDTRTRRPAS